LQLLAEAEAHDRAHNEGRRLTDLEVRRGQLFARKGDAEQAQQAFDRLIERLPGELRHRGTAAEAMLSAKQPTQALSYAETGLALARE
ncbi:hypothetical protein NSP30_23710, partial [Salmonella enterica]|nr:hypothetical protein [Salmonella enterica]